jgi:hypothetical protein
MPVAHQKIGSFLRTIDLLQSKKFFDCRLKFFRQQQRKFD